MRFAWAFVGLIACASAPAKTAPAPANHEPAPALAPCPDDLYELSQRIRATFDVPEGVFVDIGACVPIGVGQPAWAVVWSANEMGSEEHEMHRDVIGADGSVFARAPAARVTVPNGPNHTRPDRVDAIEAMDLDGDGADEWLEIDSHTDLLENFTQTLMAYRVGDGTLTPLAPGVEVGKGAPLFQNCFASFARLGGPLLLRIDASSPPEGCLAAGDHVLQLVDHQLTIE